MGFLTKMGIAKVLAVLLTSFWATMVSAQDLTLPQAATDPIGLRVPNGAIAEGMLTLYINGAETPIAGRYTIAEETLSFVPAFGFEPGQDYAVRFDAGDEFAEVIFQIPDKRVTHPAAVTAIYPSGDILPENTLRFYIHFSTPMQPQVAFDFIQLRDAAGSVDRAAFMRFKQELWNEDRTRLTVLIDPGRIKREVATNVELGPALVAGRRYTLVVDSGWPSADGSTMLPAFAKTFQVSRALRSRPDTHRWSTNVPCVGTRSPLTVAFDRPFDRHLLMRSLRVQTGEGRVIGGKIDVERAEQVWRFTPTLPWPAYDLWLIADTTLEDVAGNNFYDLLDHVAGQEDSGAGRATLLINTRNCSG